jgi:hypothetical protein
MPDGRIPSGCFYPNIPSFIALTTTPTRESTSNFRKIIEKSSFH